MTSLQKAHGIEAKVKYVEEAISSKENVEHSTDDQPVFSDKSTP